MFKHDKIWLFLTVIIMAFLVSVCSADRRRFVWTYEYQTMPAGSAELEHYFGYRLTDRDVPEAGSYSHQLEIEIGITDRWDVSIYQIFSQVNESGFEYDGFKLRTRYALFETGMYPVDPLLYLEVKRPADHARPTVLEGKIILARTHRQLFSAFNLVVERELGSGHELEWKYDIGLGFEVMPALSLALEAKGNFESGDDSKHGLGPTLSMARGSIWLSTGILFPLTSHTSDFELRYIMGIYSGCTGRQSVGQGADSMGRGDSGAALYRRKCAFCHSLVPPGNKSDREWPEILAAHDSRVRLSAEERSRMLDYLMEHN